jgi:DNA relaxase NicK
MMQPYATSFSATTAATTQRGHKRKWGLQDFPDYQEKMTATKARLSALYDELDTMESEDLSGQFETIIEHVDGLNDILSPVKNSVCHFYSCYFSKLLLMPLLSRVFLCNYGFTQKAQCDQRMALLFYR